MVPGSEPARAVARAGYRLPPSPAEKVVRGATPQLLVRAADGSALLSPQGSGVGGLRVEAHDAGVGVEQMRLLVTETEPGVLTLSVEAFDAFGQSQALSWRATAER